MLRLTVLMGDCIFGFFYKEMHGRFARPKKSGCNNEVAVRRGFTVVKERSHIANALLKMIDRT